MTYMNTRKKVLLLVDDSPIIIERLMYMLEELDNIEVILQSESYANALKLIESNHPDIIILDINLPDKSGLDLLRLIKKEYPNTTVIMVTNQTGEYYRNLCQKLGADYFIDKSSEFEQVPVIISSIA